MSQDRPLDGKRILVVEDDFYLASDEKALLERAGASVIGPFRSSCREHELEAAGSVDGAVLDINLGEGPSFEFAELLTGRGIPFIFVTGYDAAVIPAEFVGTPRIEKPIREREFIGALRDIVR